MVMDLDDAMTTSSKSASPHLPSTGCSVCYAATGEYGVAVEKEPHWFEIIENHCEDLLTFKSGYLEVVFWGSFLHDGAAMG